MCSWNRQKLSSKMLRHMTFAGIWHQVHPSSVSSNILPTYLPWYRLSIPIMSWWNLTLCLSLTSPRFSVKKFQVLFQKAVFQTQIASHSFVRSQQVLHILIVRCFVISQDVLANPLKWQPCISFSLIQVFIKLFVSHQFPDLVSYKYTLFNFCVTHIWELIPHIFKSMTGFIHTFHKVFHEVQFHVQRG